MSEFAVLAPRMDTGNTDVRHVLDVLVAWVRAGVAVRNILDALRIKPAGQQLVAHRALRAMLNGELATPFTYVCGGAGLGKSTEAARIVMGHAAGWPAVKRAAFVRVPDLLREVRDTYRSGSAKTESQVITMYSETPLLVLDDLGSEKPTAASVALLLTVIDRRYAAYRCTAITSNFPLQGLAAHLAVHETELQARRIVDRIFEAATVVDLSGPSFRQTATAPPNWQRAASLLSRLQTEPAGRRFVSMDDHEIPLKAFHVELASLIGDDVARFVVEAAGR